MHIRSLSSFRLVVCFAVCAVSTGAHAEAPVETAATARAAQREGDRLRDAGDLNGALERYTVAHAALAEPTSGLRLANAQAALGLLVEARQTAATVAAMQRSQREPAEFARARKAAAKLAASLEPRLSMFEVTVTPATTFTLRIDGWLVPENMQGLRFRTNPGAHVLEVEAQGFRKSSQPFTLAEGAYQVLLVALAPEAEPTVVAQPAVVVASEPKTPTPTPREAAPPPASAPPPEAAPARGPIAATPREEDSVADAQRTRAYVALAVGGAVIGAGAITGLVSFIETSNAKDSCEGEVCPSRLRGKLQTADTLANVSNIALPLGVLGVAYGLYELLTISEPSPVQLQVGATGAYASWRGHL